MNCARSCHFVTSMVMVTYHQTSIFLLAVLPEKPRIYMEVPRSAGGGGGGRRSRWQRGQRGQRHRRRQRHQHHEHGLAQVADGGAVGPYEEGAAARLRCVVQGGRPRPNVTWVSLSGGDGEEEGECFIFVVNCIGC